MGAPPVIQGCLSGQDGAKRVAAQLPLLGKCSHHAYYTALHAAFRSCAVKFRLSMDAHIPMRTNGRPKEVDQPGVWSEHWLSRTQDYQAAGRQIRSSQIELAMSHTTFVHCRACQRV